MLASRLTDLAEDIEVLGGVHVQLHRLVVVVTPLLLCEFVHACLIASKEAINFTFFRIRKLTACYWEDVGKISTETCVRLRNITTLSLGQRVKSFGATIDVDHLFALIPSTILVDLTIVGDKAWNGSLSHEAFHFAEECL